VVHDERLLLLNRIAPIVPYTGAFIATCNWNLKKCAVYIFASAIVKFSIIVLISWASFDQLKEDVAPWVSLAFVAVFMPRQRHCLVRIQEASDLKGGT